MLIVECTVDDVSTCVGPGVDKCVVGVERIADFVYFFSPSCIRVWACQFAPQLFHCSRPCHTARIIQNDNTRSNPTPHQKTSDVPNPSYLLTFSTPLRLLSTLSFAHIAKVFFIKIYYN